MSPQARPAGDAAQRPLLNLEENLTSVLVGQDAKIKLLLAALVARGHVLIVDVPGTGKTVLVKALARSLAADFRRIQCTADLLPSDITGVSIYDQKNLRFEFQPGPIFANLVLADEINRASPRTQSALLEAMAEGQVTSESVTRPLPQPHFVVATQNPLDLHGTYPLPQAQLDRFWLLLEMAPLDARGIVAVLSAREHDDPLEGLQPVTTVADILGLQEQCAAVTVADSIMKYLSVLSGAIAKQPDVLLAPSTRAILHLQRLSQAWALVNGRDYVLPDDVKYLLKPALGHRITIRPRGPSAAEVMDEVLKQAALPMR